MMLHVCAIASGSNGNCYYIGNEEDAILIDAGISCRQIELRMQQMGLSLSKVRAIFLTHEHIDHTRGLSTLVKKYQIPVFLTDGTQRACGFGVSPDHLKSLIPDQLVSIGKLEVLAFLKIHDAAAPVSCVVRQGNKQVGVFTDIGQVCPNLRDHFSKCDIAFLESNYDEAMLDNGKYPYFLKNRIRGGFGHLSNSQARSLYEESHSPELRLLLLSHLSGENNCPDLTLQLFRQAKGPARIVVTSRHAPTAVYQIKTEIIQNSHVQNVVNAAG